MTYKYFIFDFDGMLCDSYDHISTALLTTLKESRGISYPYKQIYDSFKVSFKTAFTTFNVTEQEKAILDALVEEKEMEVRRNKLENIVENMDKVDDIQTNDGEEMIDEGK